jgi:hypothetical protein
MQMLMPYLLATYITTLASAMAQVAATKMKEEFGMLCRGAEGEVLFILKFFTQVVQVGSTAMHTADSRQCGVAATRLQASPLC